METSYEESQWLEIPSVFSNYETNGTNSTMDAFKSMEKIYATLYTIMIPILGVIVIILNSAVVISSGLILKREQEPRATYIFLGNVAMADLITGITMIFGLVLPSIYKTRETCAIEIGMICASTLSSMYSVGLIAIDRYLYILYGLKYNSWLGKNTIRLMILFTWTIGCVIGSIPFMGWYGQLKDGVGEVCRYVFLPKGLILLTVVTGMIPMIVVVVLYSIILFNAIRNINKIDSSNRIFSTAVRETNDNNSPFRETNSIEAVPSLQQQPKEKSFFATLFSKAPTSVSSSRKSKAIKVVIFTTGGFLITWTPYFVTCLYYVHTCTHEVTQTCRYINLAIESPLAILGFANSLINPIIYAWWHIGFRTFVQRRIDLIIRAYTSNKTCRNYFASENSTSPRSSSTIDTGSTNN